MADIGDYVAPGTPTASPPIALAALILAVTTALVAVTLTATADDTYVFTGLGLGHDRLFEAGEDDAALNDEVPETYRGLDRFDARKKIVEEFESLGLLDKVEDYTVTFS